MDAQDLDALVYPSGTPYGTQGTNMRLSPNTGMPAVTVPMGQATAADATITGAGVNLEFLGRSYDEGTVIGLGYGFEQATHARTSPALYPALG
jgi:amidase